MTQHAPGPWTLKRATVKSATGRVVARIPALNADDYYVGKRETPPQDSLALQLQREANAALIAAAPAMLEALQRIAATPVEFVSAEALPIARAAIAAAKRPNDTHRLTAGIR